MVQSCGGRGVAGCISMAERPKPGSLARSDIHFLVPFNKSLPATVVSVISKKHTLDLAPAPNLTN